MVNKYSDRNTRRQYRFCWDLWSFPWKAGFETLCNTVKVRIFMGHYRPRKTSFHQMLFYFELLTCVNYWQLWPNNYAIFPYLYLLPDVKSQQLLYIIWPFLMLYIFSSKSTRKIFKLALQNVPVTHKNVCWLNVENSD